MTSDQLRARQAPLKDRYRQDPAAATITFHSRAEVDPQLLQCRVAAAERPLVAGLHAAAGGDQPTACSGDMLLDALVACAGVTLAAVASAMGVVLRRATIAAEGEADFRGTLGVDKSVPVGLAAIRLRYELDTDAPEEQIEKLLQLTERYCVIYQTLRQSPSLAASWARSGPSHESP